jgi:hypothetical protein
MPNGLSLLNAEGISEVLAIHSEPSQLLPLVCSFYAFWDLLERFEG